jgi:hypothetical protein
MIKFYKVSYEQFKKDVEGCGFVFDEADIKYAYDNIKLPKRATKASAGYDFYAPFEFTHQRGVLQASTCFYNRDMPYPGDIEIYRGYGREVFGWKNPYKEYEYMDEKFIRDALKPVVEFVKAHPDKILWCGEFGNIRHAKLEWREKWFSDVIKVFKENDIPYAVWNYLSTPNDGNRFSLVDDEKRQILSKRFLKVLLGKKSV